jgi:CRP-like cAMP-binding protein
MATSKPPRGVPANRARSDGNPMRNLILLSLPADESDAVLSKLVFVELPTKFVLLEAAQPIKFVYFMNGGLASVLNKMTDGKSVEVGLAGNEGFIGLPLVVGLSTSATRVIIQVKGSAYRMTSKDFVEILPQCPQLEKHLNRFALHLGNQAIHVAACNRLHEVHERLARWLLMSQDRLGGNIVPPYAGISSTHAWYAQGQRDCRCRHFAEIGINHLHSRRSEDRQPPRIGRRRI